MPYGLKDSELTNLKALFAKNDRLERVILYGSRAKGTYKHRGRWGSLDHILVSSSLRQRLVDCHVHDAPFLTEEDEKYGGIQPRRTYVGHRYHAGYSDHLPLVAKWQW